MPRQPRKSQDSGTWRSLGCYVLCVSWAGWQINQLRDDPLTGIIFIRHKHFVGRFVPDLLATCAGRITPPAFSFSAPSRFASNSIFPQAVYSCLRHRESYAFHTASIGIPRVAYLGGATWRNTETMINAGGLSLCMPARDHEPQSRGISLIRVFTDSEKIQAMRAVLAKRFPACFLPKGQLAKKPLKIGIRQDVFERAPDLHKEYVARAIGDYTTGPSYAKAMVAGAVRVDLDGQAAGIVSESAEGDARFREQKRVEQQRRYHRDIAKLKEIEAQTKGAAA